jgi:hypothetical protein
VDRLEDDDGRLPMQAIAAGLGVLDELFQDLAEQILQPGAVGHDLGVSRGPTEPLMG